MTTWEFGLESQWFDMVLDGQKSIEARLNTGKFAQFQAGDVIKIRRDYRDERGVLQDGTPDQARVGVVAVRRYASSLELMQAEGFEQVIPTAKSAEEAAAEYDKYYAPAEQAKFGVLALEIRVI